MTARSGIRTTSLGRLRRFIVGFGDLIDGTDMESEVLGQGSTLLRDLVAHDDWLPQEYARPGRHRYRQHLLHCDSRERFSIVSFAWGPGQATPVHDHTVWGLVGVLRGSEMSQAYRRCDGGLAEAGPPKSLAAGDIEALSPSLGDIHRVWNPSDTVSVSIHVYGANIGAVRRSAFSPDGSVRTFVSGYANARLPNLWNGVAGGETQSA